MIREVFEHESSYKGYSPASIVHRYRLKKIKDLFAIIELPDEGRLADFGCSNGFILRQIKDTVFKDRKWQFYGYDHNRDLIAIAKNKNMDKCIFDCLDLNTDRIKNHKFDIVTCFETIEHLGNWKNGLDVMIDCCTDGGVIIISVPNEKKIQGLVKFISRKLVRRNPYKNFFSHKFGELKYLETLLNNGDIESFRKPAPRYGPHLGYDWEKTYRYIHNKYIKNKIDQRQLKLHPNDN